MGAGRRRTEIPVPYKLWDPWAKSSTPRRIAGSLSGRELALRGGSCAGVPPMSSSTAPPAPLHPITPDWRKS